MGIRLHSGLRFFARTRLLPKSARAAYALVAKRLWGLVKVPVVAEVPGAGRMRLEPWDFLDARMFFFGTWEPSITRFIRAAARPEAVAIDIGANIGYYSLLLSREVGPSGRVYAIEPGPTIRARLETNLALNDAANVVTVPYGVSDRRERRAFELSERNLGASHFGDVAEDGIELRPLAEMIAPEDLARVHLIKIDVEGMEEQVLRHLLTLLPQLPRELTIVAELRVNDAVTALIEAFREQGFRTLLLENVYEMWHYPDAEGKEPALVDAVPFGQHDIALVRP